MEYKKEDIIKVIKEKGFIPLYFDWNGYDSIVNFKDKDGYKYSVTWGHFYRGDNFKICFTGNNNNSLDNIKNYIRINNYECEIAQDYPPKDCYDKIKIKGKCGHIFERSWVKFIQKNVSKNYCPSCNRKINPNRKLLDIDKYYKLFEKYDYKILENLKDGKKRKNDTKILVEDKNGYKGYLTYANLQSRKDDCKFSPFHKTNKWSCNNIKLYFENNNINTKLVSEQYNGIDVPLKFVCECGEEFQRIFPQFRTPYKCQKCLNSISNYEMLVENFLKHNNIYYIKQKRFKDCKDKRELPFDFYIPKLNVCIEVQGEQHYMAIVFGNYDIEKAQYFLEEQKRRDEIKRNYCIKNKIPLIELKYDVIKDGRYKDILNKLL